MSDYTALAIGINRYQYIQPLNYAQDDAQALHQLLVEETELPPHQALLLTEASPWVGNHSTEPTRDQIWHWVDTWLAAQTGSLLWFFFSGYGVSWQGVDYLMPMDGNPADIPGTGIVAKDLLARLQGNGQRRVLALLDINRSPGVIAGETVGGQLAQIAPEMGISLILSSQLEEASHEAVALGHGMFTAALLEALRYYGPQTTLDGISSYLYERLPELSEHHWRPVQHPLIIIPSIEFAQAPLFPQTGGAEPAPVEPPPMVVMPIEADSEELPPELAADPIGPLPAELAAEVEAEPEPEPVRSLDLPPFSPPPPEMPPIPTLPTTAPTVPAPAQSQPRPTPQKTQYNWLLWGGGLLLILAIWGLFNVLFGDRPPQPETVTEPGQETPTTIPPTPGATPAPAAPAAPPTLAESQAILARARTYIQDNQASGFSRAIAEAGQIPPGAPLYEEAQGDIARWSAVILDLAKGRANQGQFDGAIAAAQLIPANQTAAYAAAQQSIGQWTQNAVIQKENAAKIREARRLIRYTQASSFLQGINLLKTIPQGQPGYQQAQELIRLWQEQIYLIANSRAARGDFEQAIATARLVPADAPSYAAAQTAISRWEKGHR